MIDIVHDPQWVKHNKLFLFVGNHQFFDVNIRYNQLVNDLHFSKNAFLLQLFV